MKRYATTPKAEEMRAYRRRLIEEGQHQLIVALPNEIVALLDEIKQRQRLRSRSQVLLRLIQRGRGAAQQ
jgi:hypothetical protein